MINNITQEKVRQSNMEMLRIISMMMILGTHADYYDISSPWIKYIIDSFNNVGSDCFVLISGWFGIHPHKRGLLNFLFIIFFYLFLSYFCQVIFGEQTLDIASFIHCIVRNPGWFILAYLGLYTIAPVLNSFIDNAKRTTCKYIIIGWAIYTFLFGYVIDFIHLERGYSCFSFILLYLLARYANKYKPKFTVLSYKVDLIGFTGGGVLTASLLVISNHIGHGIGGEYYFRAYNSPLVILTSFYLILFFSKLNFQSKVVNFFAKSAFSVYMIHSSLFVYDKYRGIFCTFFDEYNNFHAILITMLFIPIVYVICVIIDQTRIFSWHFIDKKITTL